MARLKCKDGDLALVIYDTPGSQQNIGKVVQVLGPATMVIRTQMIGWRIKPLFPAPWGVTQLNGSIGVEVVDWNSGVFHEDEWLMPIRPLSPDETWQEIQSEIDKYLVDVGAVAPLAIWSSRLGCRV
jgi:hypothetical protein